MKMNFKLFVNKKTVDNSSHNNRTNNKNNHSLRFK